MGRILKVVVGVAILGFVGLTGYAYLGDLSPAQTDVSVAVTLNAEG